MQRARAAAGGTPLLRRVVIPLLGLGVVVIAAMALALGAVSRQHLEAQLWRRAETIAHAVGHVAESTRHLEDLRRVVNAMGAEPDVELVSVVGGEPPRVLAATRGACIDAAVTDAESPCIDGVALDALRSGHGRRETHGDGRAIDVSIPLQLVSEEGQPSRGAVMVHLAPTRMEADVAATTHGAAGALGAALAVLALLTAWMLRRHVLRPIHEITALVAARDDGARDPAGRREEPDELHRLARVLEQALSVRDRREAETQVLHRAAEMACREIGVAAAFAEALALIANLIRFPIGHVAFVDLQTGEASPSEIWHVSAERPLPGIERFREVTAQTRFARGIGLPGRVVASGESHWIEDVRVDDNFPRARACPDLALRTAIASPVLAQGRCIAVLEFFSDQRFARDEDLRRAVDHVCRQVGRVIERKQAEEEMRRVQAQLAHHQLALDETAIVAVTDVRGRISYVNDRFCQISGWSREELLGSNHRVLASGEHSQAFFREMYRTIARGRVWRGELKNRRRDGRFYWVDTTIVPSIGPGGKVDRYTSIRIDITARKLAEQATREAERRTRAVLDSIPVMVWSVGPDGASTDFNRAWLEFTGHTLEEEIAGGWEDGIFDRDRESVVATCTTAFDARQPFEIQYRLRRHDGLHRWVLDRGVPHHAVDGTFLGYLGGSVDITERIETQRTLERTNAELATAERKARQLVTAVEAAGDAIFVCDGGGRILYCNTAFTRLSGWSREEVVGLTPAVLKGGRTERGVYDELWATILGGGTWSGRLLNRRRQARDTASASTDAAATPGSDLYWAESTITPIASDDGIVSAFVAVQRDVTERVLREAEERAEREGADARLAVARAMQADRALDARFDEALAAIFQIDDLQVQQRGGVFVLEPGASALSLCKTRGRFSEEFLRGEASVPLGRCLCGRAAESGEVLISDDCFEDHRHEHRWPGMTAHGHYIVPLMNVDECVGVLFLYTDVRPSHGASRLATLRTIGEILALAIVRDRAARQMEEGRRRAEEASRAKSDFLATMSHEIRTPMNGVIGFTNLLLDTRLDAEQREFADTIRSSGQALLSIINDILDFSKIEAGKLALERIPYDLRATVAEAVDLMGPRAEEKQIELLLDWEEDVPASLVGDPTRARQVLLNLIGNALKFTEHGHVMVSARCIDGGRLRLSVCDTGIGIPRDRTLRLFEKFVQADCSTTRRFGGTGLGLAISKQLVELMGGEIGVESEEGQGATFWFTLPLPSTEIEVAAPIEAVALAGRRILVVDDLAVNRRVLCAQLLRWSTECEEAPSGEVALQRLRDAAHCGRPFDVALIDQLMPRMDGEMLGRAIRADASLAATALVLIGSAACRGDRPRWIEAGFSEVLVKPIVRPSQLAAAIGKAIRGAQRDALRPGVAAGFQGTQFGPPRARAVRWHVLLAEDNHVNQRLAVRVLQKAGCSVDVANDGLEACERIAATQYDVVFMDCHMPNMDGLEATQVIRGRESMQQSSGSALARRTPIVALTADAMEGDRERCLALGMDDYVSKPFTHEQIENALQRWAPRDGSERTGRGGEGS